MKPFCIVALYLTFSPAVLGSSFDPSKTVLQLHELKVLSAEFGTAACLDAQCRYLLSNAHVARVASPHAIHGDPVVQKFLATGPTDEGAVMNTEASGAFLYNPSRDLAIYELVKPMKGFQGMPFTLEPLILGDEVSMIAFPGRTIGVANLSRTLTTWHGSFIGEDQNGCLAFRYTPSETGERLRPGISGGIVVWNGKIVGILRGMAQTELIAEAVPVSSLEVFLAKVNPYLHAQLFPQAVVVSPVSFDAFPPWNVPEPAPSELERRTPEPFDVQRVRAKSQALYESMKYFVARQTFSWSEGGSPQLEAEYSVTVRNGVQRFTSGNHEFTEIPPPAISGYVVPSSLWLNAPRYATTDLSLHLRHAGTIIVNRKPVDVYQWQALGPESKICRWKENASIPLFQRDKLYRLNCYGEVWLSADGDILRISEVYILPPGPFAHYEAVVVYGRVVLDGESHLVPMTISTYGQVEHSKPNYCYSFFSDYKLWGSQAQLLPSP